MNVLIFLIGQNLRLIVKLSQAEDAGDDGAMPPLEGAEEDASRMEEVGIAMKSSQLCPKSLVAFSLTVCSPQVD